MKIAIIGGGPAGLRAAEVAAENVHSRGVRGAEITLFDAKRSVGRKFLVAGRGGLNLTKEEPFERFVSRYRGLTPAAWQSMITGFDPDALRAWAAGLGVETFAASTGRVYPRELKAAPLLRRWIERLRRLGVKFAMGHRWEGLAPSPETAGPRISLEFAMEGKPVSFAADVAILALGGGSWPETGSDGRWTAVFSRLGIPIAPLEPANCGWETSWPDGVLAAAEGKPLKNVAVQCGSLRAEGELMLTRYGLEGGAIYQIGPALRDALREHGVAELEIDLKPGSSPEKLLARLGTAKGNWLAEAVTRWRLSPAVHALLQSREPFASAGELVAIAKAFRVPLRQPRPIAEAISSAGGVRAEALTEDLMLRQFPGVFVAGEMIDWEAPTGGYLIQGCFATGTRAAQGAMEFLRRDR